MEEIWKVYRDETVNSYHNHRKSKIEVSNKGNVKRDGILVDFLKYKDKKGYYRVCGFNVHRMVAELFIPNPDNKPYIDHIDGNPHNNNYNNLHWVTQKENMNNPITIQRNSQAQQIAQNRLEVRQRHSIAAKKIQKEIGNRPEVRLFRSNSVKGENNPMYGTTFQWMTNGIENKRGYEHLVDKYLQMGYYFGMTKK